MAQNPMQRKMTNAFLLGMFITLLIAAVIVMLLFTQLKNAKADKAEAEENYNAVMQTVYVAGTKIPEGVTVYGTDEAEEVGYIVQRQVATSMLSSDLLQTDDLYTTDEAGDQVQKVLQSAIEIPAGTVLTSAMLKDGNINSSERLMEYNMISLPSQLLEDTYIDIRILLPSGEDFVVVSKKHIEQVDATTIWMRMTEDEIEILSNAIIESYIIDGSKLYATEYTSPTSQASSVRTYIPNSNVQLILKAMLGESSETYQDLATFWSGSSNAVRAKIEAFLGDSDEQKEKAAEGIEEEKSNLQSARNTFLESMGY